MKICEILNIHIHLFLYIKLRICFIHIWSFVRKLDNRTTLGQSG
jgi:hypothetical protein